MHQVHCAIHVHFLPVSVVFTEKYCAILLKYALGLHSAPGKQETYSSEKLFYFLVLEYVYVLIINFTVNDDGQIKLC